MNKLRKSKTYFEGWSPMPENNTPPIDLVLIDDDELVRMTWKMVAETKGHHIRVFESYDAFSAEEFETDTPIYVDYDLGKNVKGTDVAERIIESGFRKVYLTTGYPLDSVATPELLSGIINKEYPVSF